MPDMRLAPVLVLALVTACGGSSTQSSPPVTTPEPEPARAPEPDAAPQPQPEPEAEHEPEVTPVLLPAPPWAGEPVKKPPAVFVSEHKKAANRATCPLLVPTELGEGAGAKPRRATFHGGWAVAYDKKGLPGTLPSGEDCATCGRGAFGIAGTGVGKEGGPAWPNEIRWSDGSHAGYGPEGGTAGARALAFLSMADAECLYNVWSSLGEEHLVTLLGGLRLVE